MIYRGWPGAIVPAGGAHRGFLLLYDFALLQSYRGSLLLFYSTFLQSHRGFLLLSHMAILRLRTAFSVIGEVINNITYNVIDPTHIINNLTCNIVILVIRLLLIYVTSSNVSSDITGYITRQII